MIRWTEVPLRVLALDEKVATGARVPGRIVAMEAYRRTASCEGVEVGAAVDAIEWDGLEDAVAWLDQQDVHGAQVVRVPRVEA